MRMIDLVEIAKSIIEGNISRATNLTKTAIDANISAREILDNGLVAAMQAVGDRFEKGEIFFPELLMSGEAGRKALKLLRPSLIKQERTGSSAGKAAIARRVIDLVCRSHRG